jgi:NTE family protein
VVWKWLAHRASDAARRAEARGPRFGLVLGGGAVRGAAHLGVLSVLEREDIHADIVAGTSSGAIVGAGVAAGVPAAEMYGFFKAARWTSLARPSWPSRLSLLDADPMGALVERITEAKTFGDLSLPFAAVACDILTGTPFVFTEGSLREALVASSALPGLFEPVRRDGHLLIDGGVTDNLPIGAARDLGATVIVAVDITPQLDGSFEPRDVRDMLLMSWGILERSTGSGADPADLVVTPDVTRVSPSDFSQAPAAYDAGVEAAEQALPELRAILDEVGWSSRGEHVS